MFCICTVSALLNISDHDMGISFVHFVDFLKHGRKKKTKKKRKKFLFKDPESWSNSKSWMMDCFEKTKCMVR